MIVWNILALWAVAGTGALFTVAGTNKRSRLVGLACLASALHLGIQVLA